jgi:hypothetical protein
MCCDLCDLYLNCEEVDAKTVACCHKCVEYSDCLGGKSADEDEDEEFGDLDEEDLDEEEELDEDDLDEDDDFEDDLDDDPDEDFDEELKEA